MKTSHSRLSSLSNEVGQAFAPEVIVSIYKQTGGQPVLVSRFGQILTEELNIPKTESIAMEHFTAAHAQLLQERNTNIDFICIASWTYSNRS